MFRQKQTEHQGHQQTGPPTAGPDPVTRWHFLTRGLVKMPCGVCHLGLAVLGPGLLPCCRHTAGPGRAGQPFLTVQLQVKGQLRVTSQGPQSTPSEPQSGIPGKWACGRRGSGLATYPLSGRLKLFRTGPRVCHRAWPAVCGCASDLLGREGKDGAVRSPGWGRKRQRVGASGEGGVCLGDSAPAHGGAGGPVRLEKTPQSAPRHVHTHTTHLGPRRLRSSRPRGRAEESLPKCDGHTGGRVRRLSSRVCGKVAPERRCHLRPGSGGQSWGRGRTFTGDSLLGLLWGPAGQNWGHSNR